MTTRMHRFTDEVEVALHRVVEHISWRVGREPTVLGRTARPEEMRAALAHTLTEEGLGLAPAVEVLTSTVLPACLATDHPGYLAFVPGAPTEASVLADMVLSAEAVYGGSWLEASGAVEAENQALRWIADLAGLPAQAGGCFVQGGTIGNLSALVAARHAAVAAGRIRAEAGRPAIVCATTAHSSVGAAARVMGVDLLAAAVAEGEALHGGHVEEVLAANPHRVFAVVGTAGTTNLGLVDDLDGIGEACARHGVWFHVDGAYGLAALAAPSARPRFAGVERADSLIVDPHKWLFAPYDSCALVYRDAETGRRAHGHDAAYLEPLAEAGGWNPSDYAIHLTRRPRGLPFWFSLVAYGTRAYAEAIERTLSVAREAAALVASRPELELIVEPHLSVVPFRRLGWGEAEYRRWSAGLLDAGLGLVVPTRHEGRPAARLCVVNPTTTREHLEAVLAPTATATGAPGPATGGPGTGGT
jgi:glutamate/tyrosine decarboxylase-like PLP-dependent enzyme